MKFLKFNSHQLLPDNAQAGGRGAVQEKRVCCRNWIRGYELQLSSSSCWRADPVLAVAESKVGQLQLHAIPFVNDTLAEHQQEQQELQLMHIHLHGLIPFPASSAFSSSSSSSRGCRPQQQKEKQQGWERGRRGGKHFVDLLTFCDVIKVDCHRLLHVLA